MGQPTSQPVDKTQTPPRQGLFLGIIVVSQVLLLLVSTLVTVPLIDPTVPNLTVFVYQAKDRRSYALGSCQTGEQSRAAYQCIDSIGKQSIEGNFKDVPSIMKLTLVWPGLLMGSLLMAIDAWIDVSRQSALAQDRNTSYRASTDTLAAGVKSITLVTHSIVAALILLTWILVAAWIGGSKGISIEAIGYAYLVMTPIFVLTWIAGIFGAFRSNSVRVTNQDRSGYW